MSFVWAFARGLGESVTSLAASLKSVADRVETLEKKNASVSDEVRVTMGAIRELKRSLEGLEPAAPVRKKVKIETITMAEMADQETEAEEEAREYDVYLRHKAHIEYLNRNGANWRI